MAKKSKPEKENKGGRPSAYKPEYCDVVLNLMREGASIAEVAAEIGVVRSTIYEWAGQFPKFSDTLKIGNELSLAWWEKNGRVNLLTQGFNATLWYMNMKNRHGWRDKVETSGNLTLRHEDALSQLE